MPNTPVRMGVSVIPDPDSPRIKSELQLLPEKNIKEEGGFFASLLSDPKFADFMRSVNTLNRVRNKTSTTKKNLNIDPTFRASIRTPLEGRKSARLENKSPIFTEDDLPDRSSFKKRRYDNDYSDLEDIVYVPRQSMDVTKRKTRYSPRIPVEDVTEFMINNIARKVSTKVYSERGTSCHQCRQKTNDQKTCCRNDNCVGIRGQFCGVCLENRYGEDAAKALMDPKWHCPVCRGICNCSFCRTKAGKRPTGILFPIAHQAGHKSVKDLLDSLKGEGDYPYLDDLWKKFNNPDYLLGFSKDLSLAYMGAGLQHKMDCGLTLEKMDIFRRQLEKKLLVRDHDESYHLLGFVGDTAYMNHNIQIEMQYSISPEKFHTLLQEKQSKVNFMMGVKLNKSDL